MSNTSVLRRLLVGASPKRTVLRAVLVGLLAFVVFRFLVTPVRLRGGSMEPTYHDRSFVWVNALRYRFGPPRRGDVVAIRMAGRKVMLFKRVLGLPGERVAFREGQLIIDSAAVDEPWIEETGTWNMPEVLVGDNEFFVAGDNRAVPIEQHTLGRAQRSRIAGGPFR